MKHDLKARTTATQATVDKFRNRAFDWHGTTCIHLLRFHLRQMGYRPPPIPRFQSPIGAKRALTAAGFDSVAALIDGLGLPRIAPAMMLVGDVAVVPGEGGWDAVWLCAGGKMIGWREDADGLVNIAEAIGQIDTAWRA